MNLIDVLIILFLLTALARGIEMGMARQLCSTTGLFVGLFVGVFIQGKLINLVNSTGSKAMLALVVIVISIAAFSSAGEYIGIVLKRRIDRTRIRGLITLDKLAGSVVSGVTLLLAIWLGATIFANTPPAGLQRQLKGSVIIAGLNKSMPSAPDVVTRLGHLIDPNGFPNVFTGLEPAIDTNKPLPSNGELDPAVQKDRSSTVKIEGEGCGGISQGSGFVAGEALVVTNAHVVAGVEYPFVIDANGRHRAQVIGFDPDLDMAVLRTNNLAGPPLPMEGGLVAAGTHGAIIGYPGGGSFSAHPAVVIESFRAIGRDIYNRGKTVREVYSLKGVVRPGNSGGPIVDTDGNVIGLIFAESATNDTVGYALTMDPVIAGIDRAKTKTQTVDTGSCTQ